jgi:hypothetical protein
MSILLGTKLGRYEIRSKIGEGVWLGLKTLIALKGGMKHDVNK